MDRSLVSGHGLMRRLSRWIAGSVAHLQVVVLERRGLIGIELTDGNGGGGARVKHGRDVLARAKPNELVRWVPSGSRKHVDVLSNDDEALWPWRRQKRRSCASAMVEMDARRRGKSRGQGRSKRELTVNT